jgi:hypothetical protein
LVEPVARKCAELLGPAHPYSLGTAMNVAICEFETRHEERARDRTVELLKHLEESLDPGHPDTLAARVNLEIIESSMLGSGHRGLVGSHPADSPALAELTKRLGDEHPMVRDLRSGYLAYRVIDPHEPF